MEGEVGEVDSEVDTSSVLICDDLTTDHVKNKVFAEERDSFSYDADVYDEEVDHLSALDNTDLDKPRQRNSESFKCLPHLSPQIRSYKNVLGTGLTLMLVFSTYFGFTILQSNIADNSQLVIASLLIQNTVFLISGLFASSIIKMLGTKYTLIVSCSLSMMYGIANFYPQWYTLVPGAICFGIAQAPILASVNVHMTTIAIKYAPDLNEKSDHLIALFTGFLAMFYRMSLVIGNLTTTIILFSERHSSDSEIIDTSLGDVCNNTEVDTLNTTYVYILMSIYLLITVLAITVAMFLMDHFGTNIKFQLYSKILKLYLKEPFVATVKLLVDWKFFIQLPMTFLSPFVASVTFSQLSKYYVSECIGVHWVGLFSIAYGIASALTALTTGRLVKWIPQFIIVYFFSAIMLSIFLFILFWGREPSYIIAFLPFAIIGSCEGMWNAVPPTLIGILFPHKKEAAYSASRMGISVGGMLGFIVALFEDTRITLWFAVVLLIISLITYSLLVFTTQSKEDIFPCWTKIKAAKVRRMYTIAVTDDA